VSGSDLEAELSDRLGDLVTTRRAARELASIDRSGLQATLPDVVVRPTSVEDVLIIVEIATRRRVALTARGAGTSRAGGPIPLRGGIVLDMTGLAGSPVVSPADRSVRVEAGTSLSALQSALAEHDLTWGPFDGGDSTVGGLVARNALGPRSAGFGAVRQTVRGLSAVVGTGEIIRAGHQSRVAASGYDLAQLLVGSEGTLGIIIDVTLSVVRRPAADRTVAIGFETAALAAASVGTLARNELGLAGCRWVSAGLAQRLREFKGYDLGPGPALLLRACGASSEVERILSECIRLVEADGGRVLDIGDPSAALHWIGRALKQAHPSTASIRSDVAFPEGSLAEFVALTEDLAHRKEAALYLTGEPLLGAMEVIIRERPDDLEAWDEALDLRDHLMEFAIDRGGASSAGYGAGLDGRRYMKREHGLAVGTMRLIKGALDPAGILNPGKIIP